MHDPNKKHHDDAYVPYEQGVHKLLERLPREGDEENDTYLEGLVFQQRLTENIAHTRFHGDTETLRAERSIIIARLNAVALDVLAISFNELCGLAAPAFGPAEPLPNPYRGLFAFREEDAPFFFGRERDTRRLVAAIQQRSGKSSSRSFLAVIGSSGSGKSSLVFAGLFPLLRREETWLFATARPGNRPIASLASALVPLLEPDMSETRRIVETRDLTKMLQEPPEAKEPEVLGDVVQRLVAKQGGDRRLLLVIDQSEELYTLCTDQEQRNRFLDLILATTENTIIPLTVLFTMRVDFLGMALSHRAFADVLQDNDLKLGPMTRDELSQTISQPAEKLGISFESGLVSRILDDVGDEPGNLPLLEFALTRMWDRRNGNQLTHADYDAIGQVEGALAGYANNVYEGLSKEEHEQVRRIFVQLVNPGKSTEDTRRIARAEDLGQEGWQLVQRLANERLVVTGQDEDGQQTVEVIHEALIRRWGMLRQWMETDYEFRIWQERLRDAMRQWKASDQDEGALLRGRPLSDAETWVQERSGDISDQEKAYIQASTALREREQAARERLRRTIAAGVVGATLVLALLLVVAVWQWRGAETARSDAEIALKNEQTALAEAEHQAYAEQTAVALAEVARAEAEQKAHAEQTAVALAEVARIEAEQQARAAQAGQLASEAQIALDTKPQRSILLAIEALSTTLRVGEPKVLAAEQALRDALAVAGGTPLTKHKDGVYDVAFSSDGRWLATGSMDGTAMLWDMQANDPTRDPFVLSGHENVVRALDFSPDGRWLATGSMDGTARLWDTGDPTAEPLVFPNGAIVYALDFSPDGRWLATGNTENAYLWDMQADDPAEEPILLTGHENAIVALAFSPEGRWLATGSLDETARLWDMQADDPTATPLVLPGEGWVLDVAFSQNEQLLATADDSGTVKLWGLEADDPSAEPTILEHDEPVNAVAFSKGILVVGDMEGTIWLRRAQGQVPPEGRPSQGGEHLEGVPPQGGLPEGVPPQGGLPEGGPPQEGEQPAATNEERLHEERVFALDTARPVPLRGHTSNVMELVFSADGRWLASASTDHTIRLWDMQVEGVESTVRVLHGHDAQVMAVAFSPDGNQLASGSLDSSARLWDVRASHPAAVPFVLRGHESNLSDLAFSPDGRWLATGSWDETVRVWDRQAEYPSANPMVLSDFEGSISALAFSPNGRWLAAGSEDATLQLWDMQASDPASSSRILSGHESAILSLAFSPDGRWLASASEDTTIRLWDMQSNNPAVNPQVLQGHNDVVTTVQFSPDSRWLASGGSIEDHTARLWDMQASDPAATPLVLQGHDLGIQGVAFSPDGRWFATGSADNTARLWDMQASDPAANSLRFEGYDWSVNTVLFSPDSRWLITSSGDNTARLWDMQASDPTTSSLVLRGHEDTINTTAISPDGRWLATGSNDATIRLWDLLNDPTTGSIIFHHRGDVTKVAFSPDGNVLGSASEDTTARLWDVRLEPLIDLGCRVAGRNLSQSEWEQIFGYDTAYQKTCPHLPAGEWIGDD